MLQGIMRGWGITSVFSILQEKRSLLHCQEILNMNSPTGCPIAWLYYDYSFGNHVVTRSSRDVFWPKSPPAPTCEWEHYTKLHCTPEQGFVKPLPARGYFSAFQHSCLKKIGKKPILGPLGKSNKIILVCIYLCHVLIRPHTGLMLWFWGRHWADFFRTAF